MPRSSTCLLSILLLACGPALAMPQARAQDMADATSGTRLLARADRSTAQARPTTPRSRATAARRHGRLLRSSEPRPAGPGVNPSPSPATTTARPGTAGARPPVSREVLVATLKTLAAPLVHPRHGGWSLHATPNADSSAAAGLRLDRHDAALADWTLRVQGWQDPAQALPLGLRPRVSETPGRIASRQPWQGLDPLTSGPWLPQVHVGIVLRF